MSNQADYNFSTIENPYNNSLERGDIGKPIDSEQLPVENPNDMLAGSVSNGSFDNMWIGSWIKSKNYLPGKRGFMLDGINGDIKCGMISIVKNDIVLKDLSIGGTSPVTGDISTIRFDRTDGLDGNFIFQKRKSTVSNLGNTVEMFYESYPTSGEKNSIYIGRRGNNLTSADAGAHYITIHAKNLISLESDAAFDRTLARPEISISTYNTSMVNNPIRQGGSRIAIAAVDCDVPTVALDYTDLDATSQFDVSQPYPVVLPNTYRYTWDGTGTNPNIGTHLVVGNYVTTAGFVVPNNGTFVITAVDTNWFEVSNSKGVTQDDVSGVAVKIETGYGAAVMIGIQKITPVIGFDKSLMIDKDGGWFCNDFLPQFNSTYNLGSTLKRFANIWTDKINNVVPGSGTVSQIDTDDTAITGGPITTTGTITHTTTAGFKHIPTGGINNQYLRNDNESGKAKWSYLGGAVGSTFVPNYSISYDLGTTDKHFLSVFASYITGDGGTLNLDYSGRLQVSNHLDPNDGGSFNLGGATRYWGDISYKTLTDRGCLGWFDEGVELQDGTKVSDIEAIKSIKKHPTKKTIYGIPMLDYKSMPKVCYKMATKHDGTILPRDENDNPYEEELDLKTGQMMRMISQDGAEMTSLFSIMIGAIKELSEEISILKNSRKNA